MSETALISSTALCGDFSFAAPANEARIEAATEVPASDNSGNSEPSSEGLIADLAWILLLGAVATIIFKKLKQPVVLGYILAGFLAGPKFAFLPTISSMENIEFWAELGIVVLMFTLGLEFSFKKLMSSGSSAIVTALIIITGMTLAGFGVGRLINLNTVNCIFLGGMISMSSTTIILKSLTDMGMRQKKFASLVLAVLIIEDLFAVLMLVILSAVGVGEFEGAELLFSIGKLAFFLIIWFVVGVYVLPTFFDRTRSAMNDETLLVISMGLCFGMAVFSVYCGFSLELGAFVTGSILAGTMLAERIENVVLPVKDLFGAVFFISVGMMVDPATIAQFWPQILLLAGVVVVGMIIFGSLGMLLTGQSLRVSIESGFTLTQIGEFSFIIASLGMGLGVLDANIYPIIVAVSVITIFTTPYFIRLSQPAARFAEKILPRPLRFLIDRYSTQNSDTNETRSLWRAVIGRYVWRILLYSVILIAIILVSEQWLFPLMVNLLGDKFGRLSSTLITLGAMSPFLVALSLSSTKPSERMKLHSSASFVDVPLVAMRIVRYIITLVFIVGFVSYAYGALTGWLVGIGCFILVLAAAGGRLKQRYKQIERKFVDNLNVRENTRYGKNNNIVGDLHLAYIKVGPSCPFVGDRLIDSGLREDYGVSISSIQRGLNVMPLPASDARIFPGDVIGVIGTDDQIKHLNDDITNYERSAASLPVKQPKVELQSLVLTSDSPIVGIPLRETNIRRDFYSMIVKVSRNDSEMVNPEPDMILHPGDTIWVVGDISEFPKLK